MVGVYQKINRLWKKIFDKTAIIFISPLYIVISLSVTGTEYRYYRYIDQKYISKTHKSNYTGNLDQFWVPIKKLVKNYKCLPCNFLSWSIKIILSSFNSDFSDSNSEIRSSAEWRDSFVLFEAVRKRSMLISKFSF